ncbi:hypothetical protein K469DRAFT_606931 [Zopfia rhizophila CBS 207.26]|uniref:MFS general substrate transporter n=1 Tax=Zopfia rhizophila CBS 207.26 TaxID=1314779 RepID=A0A6A6DBW8_9PEZI|nr:hypothetical protein K469DRAFT_606931 [Zopfia rhizophila CBS 207.26]
MAERKEIAANDLDPQSVQHQFDADLDESSLPPVDRGKDAWLFLSACWVVELLVFGFGFSFGVFQNFYSTHEPFAGSTNIAVIGGLIYLGSPFVLALCRNYPRWARWISPLGLFAACSSTIASSFCNSVPQLIGTQGILLGISGCFAFCPCVVFIDQWFDKRKGMAFDVMWSAAGLGGAVIPLILDNLLNLGSITSDVE